MVDCYHNIDSLASLATSDGSAGMPEGYEAISPLSFDQQRLWLLEKLASTGAAYNIASAYLVRGNLQTEALKRSFSELVRRHQALRAFFIELDGQPIQVTAETVEWQLSTLDLSHLPPASREAEARKIAEREANQTFDLNCLPLWQVKLIRLDSETHWLLFAIHHIIFDGWSSDIFFNELVTLYEAECQGHPCVLPELTMQQGDFARWQQQRLQGKFLDDLLGYWTQKLGNNLQALDLPTDFPRPAQPTYKGATLSIQLEESLADGLRILSRQRQTTLFMTLLAAFKLLLFRYTGQTDIAVGTPIASRSRSELANTIGFLVNTLVLRTGLDGRESFLDFLDRVRVTTLEAYDCQDLPFDLLVKALRPERDLSYNPLFQVMFALGNADKSLPEQNRTLTFKPLETETHTAQFDLTLEVEEINNKLEASIEYSTDIFQPETVRRMLENFKVLVAGIVANPQQPILELPLLSSSERHQLLEVWNRSQGVDEAVPSQCLNPESLELILSLETTDNGVVGELTHYGDPANAGAIALALKNFLPELQKIAREPGYVPPQKISIGETNLAELGISWDKDARARDAEVKCLHQHFTDRARETPHKVALSDRDQQLTYGELNAKANQLAHYLVALGVKPDMPVGVCFERSPDMVVALLAVLKAGGTYLPLDPSYPEERLEYIMNDARVEVALTQSDLTAKLSGIPQHIVCLDKDRTAIAAKPQSEPAVDVALHHLAYIIYTSGSTGKPKGVMVEHQAASHFVRAAIAEYGITAADCSLQFASISFDLAIEEIFTCIAAGARLQLRTDDAIGTPSQFLRACKEWGVTVLNLPTAFWHQLVASAQIQFPSAVRLVLIGGERALPNMVKSWQQQVGDYPRLINAYGPTEATVTATTFSISRSANIRQEVPIGRPLSNTETYILDQYGQPVPIGVPGELHIGGKSLARGYLNRPDLTQLRFVPNPFSHEANARLYKTGDRTRYLPDGSIEFLGRLDNQVKIRGFRIELGEIEAALSQYPGVRETIVIASEDTPGNAQLVAYIIESPEQPVSLAELRSFLQKHLPNYMVPAAIVPLKTLPLTPNGKVDLKALPKPSSLAVTEEATYVAPRTPLEETLAVIWTETLELPKVSVRDSFFELGGHSLQAIRAMARIENEFGIELPLSVLFQAPTVEAMAQQLAQAGAKSRWTPLVPLQTNGSKRPFFAIHGGHGEVLFYQALAEHLGEDQPFYALRALGNDYPDMAHKRIEEMAACYIEAIRKVQPEGPYSIGGTSLGGIVAFEMAQQLRNMGQATDPLIMFDTGGVDDVISPLPLRERIINAFRYIPKYGIAETWHRISIRLLKLFHTDSAVEFYRATGELPQQASNVIKVWEAVWEANLEAIDRYNPQPYAGKIVLLSAKDDGDSMWNRSSRDYGWGGYVEGGIESYDLPGTHIGMFQEPNVKQLAKALEQILERAE